MKNEEINPFRVENWKAYYINLDARKDRKEIIESELKKQGINSERFSALSDDYDKCPELKLGRTTNMPVYFGQELSPRNFVKGEWGCSFSHYSIIKGHLNSGSNKILAIFEDDAHFCSDFKKRLEYLENHFNLDWDIFYLSSFCQLLYDKETNVKYVWKMNDTMYGAHSILFNPKSIPKILELMRSNAPKVAAIDNLYNFLIPNLNMYCVVPGMVSQYSSPGNIGNRHNDTAMEYFFKSFGPHIYAENLNDFNWWKNMKVVLRHRLYANTYPIRTFLKKKIQSVKRNLK